MDLLSVVMHEIGHVFGLEHEDGVSGTIMSETLAAGTRVVALESAEVTYTYQSPTTYTYEWLTTYTYQWLTTYSYQWLIAYTYQWPIYE
jgi:hypothetical protein